MNEVSDKKLAQLNTLMELTALVNSTLDTHEVRKRAIEAATRLVNAEAGSLILKDKENNELFLKWLLETRERRSKRCGLKRRGHSRLGC